MDRDRNVALYLSGGYREFTKWTTEMDDKECLTRIIFSHKEA